MKKRDEMKISMLAIALFALSACATESTTTTAPTSAPNASTGLLTEAEFSQAGWTKLDGAAVRSKLIGHTQTLVGVHKKNGRSAEAKIYYADDGTIAGAFATNSGSVSDVGRFTIADDGTYCSAWNRSFDASESCVQFFEKDGQIDSVFLTKGSSANWDWTEISRTVGNATTS